MQKLPYEEFIKRAIIKLRDPEKGKGIHVIFSGLFLAFKQYYNIEDKNTFKEIIEKLAKEGKIERRYAKGGVVIYLPGESPSTDGKTALDKILEEN